MTHWDSHPRAIRRGLLPAEILFIFPVAPLFMAPLILPRLFHLSVAQAARAILMSSVPFLCIPLTLCLVYHYVTPGLLQSVRRPLARVALHAVLITISTLMVSTAIWILGRQVCGLKTFVAWSWTCLILAFLFTVPALMVQGLRQRRTEAEQRAQTEHRLRLAAELQALQARTNPHFLFNGLNTIASLIVDDPQRAEQIVVQLAEILRYALNSGRSPRVPLVREVQIARTYLAIQEARFGARLHYEVIVDETLETALVPPLLLQPLLENALLHGLAHRREGGHVQLLVARSGASLQVKVLDDGPGPGGSQHQGSGTSLEDLAQRLVLLYGDAGTLKTGAGPTGGFLAEATLPLEVS